MLIIAIFLNTTNLTTFQRTRFPKYFKNTKSPPNHYKTTPSLPNLKSQPRTKTPKEY